MSDLVLIGVGLSWLAWRGLVAVRVGLDARRRGLAPSEIISWTLMAIVASDRYWWGARLDRLTALEARELLSQTARAHGLSNVVDVRCPLCNSEMENVFSVTTGGELHVRRRAKCAHCDFRVDACRHCAHFLPATGGATMFDQFTDFSHGRCGFYRAPEPVRTAYPQHAQRMEALGYDVLPTPKAIVDSYVPLDECTAFSVHLKHLRANRIPWLGRDRIALIRLFHHFQLGIDIRR